MKKIASVVIIILIISLLSVSCSSKTSNSEVLKIQTDKTNTIEIFYPRLSSLTPSEEKISDWQSYIRDKYGLKVKLVYTPMMNDGISEGDPVTHFDEATGKAKNGVDIGELINLSNTNGLVYVENFEMLNDLIKNDLIMPVGSFINSIPKLQGIPQTVLDRFTDSYNNTWAFPMFDNETINRKRTYNKEWLNAYGMEVPETIEEFFNYAKYIAYSDPDKNGEDDTFLLGYTYGAFLTDFADVFRAFGCYTHPIYPLPIAYNPHKLKFENIVFNENFIEAITFIKVLADEKLIINTDDANKIVGDGNSYKIASKYHSFLPSEYTKDITYGYYLKGYNESLLMEMIGSQNCIAALRFSESIVEDMNELLSIISINQESNLDFNLGIKGVDYFDEGGYYDALSVNEDGTPKVRIGLLSGLNSNNLLNKPLIRVQSKEELGQYTGISQYTQKTNQAAILKKDEEIYYDTDLTYTVSFDTYTQDILNLNGQVGGRTESLIMDIFENNTPIEEAIAGYVKELEKSGIISELIKINEN